MTFHRLLKFSAIMSGVLLASCSSQPEPSIQSVSLFHSPQHSVLLPAGSVFAGPVGPIPVSKDGSKRQFENPGLSYIRVCDEGHLNCQNGIISYALTSYILANRHGEIEVAGSLISTISDHAEVKNLDGGTMFSAELGQGVAALPTKKMETPFHQTLRLGQAMRIEGLDGSYVTFSLQNTPIYRNGVQVQ